MGRLFQMNMLDKETHIISVSASADRRNLDQAFAELMQLSEDCLNAKSKADKSLYKKCSSSEFERVTESVLKEVAPRTPFLPDEIKLISKSTFPDIKIDGKYGVEVKTTQEDKWTSTGSSIVESTRIEEVSNIYLMFGKLGGDIPEFKCLPYADCLSSIAVTHAPRYLIDMQLNSNKRTTIFSKMNVDYETFRRKEENEKINIVKDFFRKNAAKSGKPLLWWIEPDNAAPLQMRFYSDLTPVEKERLVVRMLALFPEILSSEKRATKYRRAATWMCSRYSVLNACMRDLVSAGGRVHVPGFPTGKMVPQSIGFLYAHVGSVVKLLNDPDGAFVSDTKEYWYKKDASYLDSWIAEVQEVFKSIPEMKNVNFRRLLSLWENK